MDIPGSSSEEDKPTEREGDAERRREDVDNEFCRFCSYSSLRPESVGRRRF